MHPLSESLGGAAGHRSVPRSDRNVAIHCGQLIDGTGAPPLQDATVVVVDGRIESVLTGAATERYQGPVLDATDKTLLPGLIDGHVHLAWGLDHQAGWSAVRGDEQMLLGWTIGSCQAALLSGVTTLRDCGGPGFVTLKARDILALGWITGPRLLACGPCITTTAGHAAFLGVSADTVEELKARVRQLCAANVDFIKVIASGGSMDPWTNRRRAQYSMEELAAVAADAHRLGLSVVAHANATEAIRNAVQAGIDVIAHCNWLGTEAGTIEYDAGLAGQMIEAGTYIDLNLDAALAPLSERDGWAQAWERPKPQNRWDLLADMRSKGARIYFVSDCFGPEVNTFATLLIRAASEGQIGGSELIARCTSIPAAAIGLASELGAVVPGLRADLLLVEGDITKDVGVLRQVSMVFRDGELLVEDGQLARPIATPMPPPVAS